MPPARKKMGTTCESASAVIPPNRASPALEKPKERHHAATQGRVDRTGWGWVVGTEEASIMS